MSQSRRYLSPYQRKENYESHNLQTSPYNKMSRSSHKNLLQQQQIQDLERKVDLILEHNEQLANENAQLKAQLKRNASEVNQLGTLSAHRERVSRISHAEDNEYIARRVRGELAIKQRQCETIANEITMVKEAHIREIEGMRIVIDDLTLSNNELKLQNYRTSEQLEMLKKTLELNSKDMAKELQEKVQKACEQKDRERRQQLSRKDQYYDNLIDELKKRMEQQKEDWNSRKNNLITKLQDSHNEEINQLRRQITAQFQEEMRKLEEEASERCRNEKDKAEGYIKEMLEGIDNQRKSEADILLNQIKSLKQALEARKKLLSELTEAKREGEEHNPWFQELLQLRLRMKQNLNAFLRESEILKVKMTEKHQLDVKEMVKVYEEKMDIMGCHMKYMRQENQRLRNCYEQEIRGKISQKRQFEGETVRLKNMIRKLKVELQGIQEEFRLNIDGLRDQNATFSMTIMKSMVQDKDKANFFEEENRKLRQLYDKNQQQMDIVKSQSEEKIKFYEGRIENMKRTIEVERDELRVKEQQNLEQYAEKERTLRSNLNKERQHLQQLIDQLRVDKERLDRQNFQLREKCSSCEQMVKDKLEDIEHLKSRIAECNAHIERLRFELEVAGTDNKEADSAVEQWKSHYERIIDLLEKDKDQLKSQKELLGERVQQLIYKYKLLEESLQKTTQALSRRDYLDKKVVSLGLDEGLVRNMGELFAKVDRKTEYRSQYKSQEPLEQRESQQQMEFEQMEQI